MRSLYTMYKKVKYFGTRLPLAIRLYCENLFRRHKMLRRTRKHGQHRYTVVSGAYNVAPYLDDFFRSFERQLLDFRNNIAIIMVDDGSTDQTAERIKHWQARYPANITYVYKENGGVGSARNAGLEYVKSGWVTFVDPDDFLDPAYFLEVDAFLGRHHQPENSDAAIRLAVCKPILYLETRHPLLQFSDSHPLRSCYEREKDVVRLQDAECFIPLSVAYSFFDASIIHEHALQFCDMPVSEDTLFVLNYCKRVDTFAMCHVKNAKYYYRKRKIPSSMWGRFSQDKRKYFFIPARYNSYIETCKENGQKIYSYEFSAFTYLLSWYIRDLYNEDIPNLLPNDEFDEYLGLLEKWCSHIPNENLENMVRWVDGYEQKHAVAALSFFKKAEPSGYVVSIARYDSVKGSVCLVYYCGVPQTERVLLEGTERRVEFAKTCSESLGGRPCSVRRQFWVELDAGDDAALRVEINGKSAELELDGQLGDSVTVAQIRRTFAPASAPLFSRSYRDAWLLMDREGNADDNAEHFYRYLKANHPEQPVYFGLKKSSADWSRLRAEGFEILEFGSLAFDRVLQGCQALISSHFDLYNYAAKHFPRCLPGKRHIWLQHGVTKDDLSPWMNEAAPHLDLMVAASPAEYASIVSDGTSYHLSSREVRLVGLPRHDALQPFIGRHEKMLLIMPTWRRSLRAAPSSEVVKQSDFITHWNGILASDRLRTLAARYDLRVAFFPHADAQGFLECFEIPEYVQCLHHNNVKIQDLFKQAALMLTDYSSVAFEMAFLYKPVLYYQFDQDDFYSTHWQKGYFQYDQDGFGPVTVTRDQVFAALDRLLESGGKEYRDRMERAIAFRDGQNCARLYAAVRDLLTPAGESQ